MSVVSDNSEIFNTFKDQFTDDVEKLESLIFTLVEPEHFVDSVNSLFRIFHNHKAITAFLGLDEMHKCVQKGETVLNIIRQEGVISDESQIDWLLLLSDQLNLWLEELEKGHYDLSPANENIFTQLKLKDEKKPVSETLKTLKLLYLDERPTSLKLCNVFTKVFETVTHLTKLDSLETDITALNPDLIILSQTFIDSEIYKKVLNREEFIPTIALIDKNSRKMKLKLINKGIHYSLTEPINSKSLKKVFYSIVQSHFSARKMILSNKKIQAFINTIEPLGDSIQEIQTICDDPNTSISELIKVVTNDPVCSGIILNATKSPIYSLKNITNIDQAVSTFGKRTVKALVLGGVSGRFMPSDLSMYGINETTFLEIAHLRMKLMIKWYTRINPKLLNILGVAALLGNIGQLLIARELLNQNKSEAFFEYMTKNNVHDAEYQFLRTSTAAVTSDILYFWNMSPRLIDTISYSDEPEEAIEEIQFLSLACHIVFSLIPLTEATILPLDDKIKKILLENNLDASDLLIAMAETLSHKESS